MNNRKPSKPNLPNVPKTSKLLLQRGSTKPLSSLAYPNLLGVTLDRLVLVLSSLYLVSHGFTRAKADQTHFIKKEDSKLLVAQVYIDDIIFGSTKDELAYSLSKLM